MADRGAYRWEREFLKRIWIGVGGPPVRLALWNGFEVGGPQESSLGRIEFRSPAALRRLLWDASLGFGEGYSSGEIAIQGELPGVLTSVMQAMRRLERERGPSWSLRDWLVRRKGHSLAESKSSVYHHYDLGNDFYRLWLDEQLAYTCAYYEDPRFTLEQAQVAKFDHICRKLRLKAGDVVAEAGCGWGGFALHMVREYGVRVRAYNLSKEQIAFARQRAQREGLADRVEFVEDDYRSMTGKFDVFVSVGMLEHVGVDQYYTLGRLIDRVLSDGGRGLIHTIGRNIARPLDAWTTKHIFPGAEPPSLSQMLQIFEPHGFSVLDVENLRMHYAQTLRHWLQRFDARAGEVLRMFDERFVRMWRFYLAASIAAFESGYLQLFQVHFNRAECNDVPWTRADIYEHLAGPSEAPPMAGAPSRSRLTAAQETPRNGY